MHPDLRALTPRQREIIGMMHRGHRLVCKFGHTPPQFEDLPDDDKRRWCSHRVIKTLKEKGLVEFEYAGDGWDIGSLTDHCVDLLRHRE